MSLSLKPTGSPGATADRGLSLSALAALLLFAVCVRGLFYSGYFGSDEVTYTESAYRLLVGDWSVSSYVGANRYGVNLPVAAFGWVFGTNEFSAALYSLLCSLAEVALVAHFGARMLGVRAGLLAGLVLASLPIHVHFAGRLMADAPLCLAITASFLFFWDGETRKRRLSFVIAGLAAGWAFWVKPHTIFYLCVFLSYPLVFRRFNRRWGWFVLGLAVALLANGLFFWALTGKFLFAIQNMAERHGSGYLQADLGDAGTRIDVHYYLIYLFGKVYHTWLLGYLAAVGVARWLRQPRSGPAAPAAAVPFVVWWALGLLLVLSALVVSFSPLMFIPKQTNYMLIFVAPLALLAGYGLAGAMGWRLGVLVALWLVPAMMLSAFQQASVTVFTANSKAAVRFARAHPAAVVYASTNAYRAASFERLVRPAGAPFHLRFVGDWNKPNTEPGAPRPAERYAILDSESLGWAKSEPYRRIEDRPACWVPQGVLVPEPEGAGVAMVRGLGRLAAALPVPGQAVLVQRLMKIGMPAPAYVFRIPDTGC